MRQKGTYEIALIVDNPRRDLRGLTLTARTLALRGHTVHLVPFNIQSREIFALQPDFVLFNYLRGANESFVANIDRAGMAFGVLDTEGGVITDVGDYEKNLSMDEELREKISCFLAWGPKFAEYVSGRLFPEEAVVTTGCPRFDLYSEPWAEVARDLANAGYHDDSLILMNGTFTIGNPRFSSSEEEVDMLVEEVGVDRAKAESWAERDRQAIQEMADLANRLAERFPEASVVYRPHPFEDPETYGPLLNDDDNLQLIDEGTADGWVLSSDIVIQKDCSTAVEAVLAGTPTVSPSWLPSYRPKPAARDVSIQCEDADELIERTRTILRNGSGVPRDVRSSVEQIEKRWFKAVDGRSHERVADAIVDALRRKDEAEESDQPRGVAERLGEASYGTLRTVAEAAYEAVDPRRSPLDDWDASAKSFVLEDVRTLLSRFDQVDSDHDRGRVEAVDPGRAGYLATGFGRSRSATVRPSQEAKA